ncbi:MAG: hypothetical protein KKF78_02085 [Candidatus Omnitrophica bacterium]|nr:hypothetical protein [Candidatus Omnitrophota bacterium]
MEALNLASSSPINYLKIFFRRKDQIIIPAMIGMVLGVCAGIILPKQFVSSAVILMEEGKSDNPLLDKLVVSTTVSERLSTISESMLGWESLVQLVRRLGMDKDVKTPREFEQVILAIRSKIMIKMRGRNIINISYIGKEPEMTQAVVKNILDIFIERNVTIQNQQTSDAILFIEEQLDLYKGKIMSSKIANLKDQLRALLLDSTEMHPMVKQLKEQIASKEADLKAANLEYTDNKGALSSEVSNPMIDEIKKALDSLEGVKKDSPKEAKGAQDEYFKVMLVKQLGTAMAQDEGVNTTIYNMLLSRLETAKITQRLQSSKEGTKYTILDLPRVPLDPVKPNKILVALAGLFGGLGLGIALVMGLEFLDSSFIDVEETKQFLGVPLLGAISKIYTLDGLKVERDQRIMLYSMTIILGIVLVILVMAFANFVN